MKKRSDSTLDSLSPEQKQMLRDWLVEENLGYKEAKDRLWQDFNVRTSIGALSRFYATQCFSLASSQAKLLSEQIAADLDAERNLDRATLALVKKAAFLRASARDSELKVNELATLAGIVGDSRKQLLKEQQLEFSREKFRHELKTDVEKGLDALQAELKGHSEALALFDRIKAIVMRSMEGAKS